MSAFTATLLLGAGITITPHVQGDPLASIDFGEGGSLSLIATDPAEFDRLAEAAQTAAQMLRHRIADAPAPAASRPVPQAVTGTVADPSAAAAPVARAVDIGMCRCGHPVGEHDTDGNGWCTGSTVWVDAQSDWLACDCRGYVPVDGAS